MIRSSDQMLRFFLNFIFFMYKFLHKIGNNILKKIDYFLGYY